MKANDATIKKHRIKREYRIIKKQADESRSNNNKAKYRKIPRIY